MPISEESEEGSLPCKVRRAVGQVETLKLGEQEERKEIKTAKVGENRERVEA